MDKLIQIDGFAIFIFDAAHKGEKLADDGIQVGDVLHHTLALFFIGFTFLQLNRES